MEPIRLDPHKIRAKLHSLDWPRIFDLLDRALDLVPRERLEELVRGFLDARSLAVTTDSSELEALLDEIGAFRTRVSRGNYDGIDPLWLEPEQRGNYGSEISSAFRCELRHLMQRAVQQARAGGDLNVLECFHRLFGIIELVELVELGDVRLNLAEDELSEDWIDWSSALEAWAACVESSLPIAQREDAGERWRLIVPPDHQDHFDALTSAWRAPRPQGDVDASFETNTPF